MRDIGSSFVAGDEPRKDSPVVRKARKPRGENLAGSLTGVSIPRSQSRTSNHRSEDRQASPVDAATLTHRRRGREVEVVNVSSRGAMIACGEEAFIGEPVEIRFADCNRIRASVRWVKDGKIGLEFEQRTEIIAGVRAQEAAARPHLALVPAGTWGGGAEPDQAAALRAARHGFVWNGILYWSYEVIGVRVRNISTEGAMVDCERDLPLGEQVRLSLDGAGTLDGRVRWSKGGQIGLHFAEPFDVRRLALARPAGFVGPAPGCAPDAGKQQANRLGAQLRAQG